MENLYSGHCHTPIGVFFIQCTTQAIVRAGFMDISNSEVADSASPLLQHAIDQILEYFAGCRHAFDLPVAPAGSLFYQSVWAKLVHIPYGCTISYGELAANLGNPKASRAVGNANHHNPIALIIPCHRVIGADGTLTGYASGLERKRWLLNWEKIHATSKSSSLF